MARLFCAVLMVLLPLQLKALNTTLAPAQIVANEGENVTFACSPFISVARPTLFTTNPGSMNAQLVTSESDRVVFIDFDSNRTYMWMEVNRTLDHMREFYCIVNTIQSNVATLIVNFPPSYNNLGPFTFDTQEGAKDFKIDLPFSARPSPAFEWTLNNNVIQETANRMLTSSSIRLATVDRIDRGTYVVSANNSAGSDNATIVLNIIYPPRFNAETTTVSFRPGERATLDCSVDSNPTADITIITPAGSTTSSTSDDMITISNITMSDAGRYTCRANNSVGTEVILIYTVEVGGSPGPIIGITFRVNRDTIFLSWTAAEDNGVMITEYSIIIKRGATALLTKMSATTSVTITRDELQQNKDEKNMNIEYMALIYATNLQGNGSSGTTSLTLNAVESGSATIVSTTVLLSMLLILCISLIF